MIKILTASIRQYKKDSILTPIYVIFEVMVEITNPMLMAYLIDYGFDGKNMSYVVIIGLALLYLGCNTIDLWCNGRAQCSNCIFRVCQKSAPRYVL